MNIQREINGEIVNIELTSQEEQKVYEKVASDNQCDDLKYKINQMINEGALPTLSDTNINTIISTVQPLFDDALDGSIEYKNCYFGPAEELIENVYLDMKCEGIIQI